MSIELTPDPSVADLAARTAAFVRTVVAPEEERYAGVATAGGDELRLRLQQAAREAGVFAPHVAKEYGGHGLGMRDRAVVFEEAGWSLLGPLALNIAAPDEGNMHLLEAVATAEQKERYLRPLAEGRVRSCFAMTEPAPGAGSDPAALATTATPTPGGWLVNGRKWFITGADGAAYTICMARTSGQPGDRGGATMFLIDMDAPGLRVVRHIDTLDEGFFGGHCELELEDVFVTEESVLGEVDRGFEYAQVRLAPARLTHCMRWLGIARHAQEIAVESRERARALRVAARRPRHGAGDGGRLRDRHRRLTAADLAGVRRARPGQERCAIELDRQDIRGRGGGTRRRPGAADLRVARRLR